MAAADIPESFITTVEANLDQAVAEGYVSDRHLGATLMVTVGCLMASAESTLGPGATEWIRALRRVISCM